MFVKRYAQCSRRSSTLFLRPDKPPLHYSSSRWNNSIVGLHWIGSNEGREVRVVQPEWPNKRSFDNGRVGGEQHNTREKPAYNVPVIPQKVRRFFWIQTNTTITSCVCMYTLSTMYIPHSLCCYLAFDLSVVYFHTAGSPCIYTS